MSGLCHKPQTLNLVFLAVFLNLRCPVPLIPSEILCQTHGTHCECSRLTCKQLSDQQWFWNKQSLGSLMALYKWSVLLSLCQALVTPLLSVCLSDFVLLNWGWCWGTPMTGFLRITHAGEALGWKVWWEMCFEGSTCFVLVRFFGVFLVRSFFHRGRTQHCQHPTSPREVLFPSLKKGKRAVLSKCDSTTSRLKTPPTRDVSKACSPSSVPALCHLKHNMTVRFNHTWHLAWGTVSTPKSPLWPKVALMFPWETVIVAFKG